MKFIKTKGKMPIEKNWNTVNNYELMELMPWIQEGGQVGLVIPKGLIVVDIDDQQTAQLLLNNTPLLGKCGIHSTPNGIHLIYKAPKYKILSSSKKQTYGLLEADYRTAGKGQIIYPLNKDGRKIIRPIEEDKLDIMPDIFKPVKEQTTKNIHVISEGSRNDTLYKWACKIGNDPSIDLHRTMHAINTLISEPLPDTEISALVNSALKFIEENPVASSQEIAGNRELEIAATIASDLWFDHFFFYRWVGTHWVKLNSTEVNKMIFESCSYSLSNNTLNGVITKLKTLCYRKFQLPDKHLINTRSGVYNLETKEIRPVEKEDLFTSIIEADITDVSTSKVEKIIKQITPDIEKFMLMLGHILYKDNRITEQAFMLKGTQTGGNGKDTLLCLLGTVFKYYPVDFDSINTGRFYLSNIETYDILIDTDFNNRRIEQSGNFKKIVSGSPMTAEVKHVQTPREIVSNATFIINVNVYPSVDLGSAGGFFRRWTIIKCPYDLKKQGNNPLIKQELTSGIYNNAFLKLALKGYEMLKKANFSFSSSPDVEYWESLNDPVKTWIMANYEESANDYVMVQDVYTQYSTMCHTDGLKCMSKIALGKIIMELMPGVKRLRTRQGYRYMGIKQIQD